MADPDYLALFGGDSGAAQNQAQLLAQAIQARRAGGTLASLYGAMSGDKGMAGFGTNQGNEADKLEQGLIGAAQHRASQDIQRQHLDVQQKQLEAMMGYRAAQLGLSQDRLDLQRGHLDAINKRLALQGVKYNPNTGQFENIAGVAGSGGRKSVLPASTGAAAPTPPAAPPEAAPGGSAAPAPAPAIAPAGGKILDKRLKELGVDFNPSSGRAGEFGKNQARVNAATRLLQLAEDENGNPKDLNPQQMPELSQALASLISGGGAGAQAQIEHLTPHTLRGDSAKTMQWLFGEPRGADQVAFVKNMIETAKRERDVAQRGIDQVRGQLAQKHQMVLRGNPEEARRVLNGFGWDLDQNGNVFQKGAAPTDAKSALRAKYGL